MRTPFPARYALLSWVAALFLGVNTVVRVGLAGFEWSRGAGLGPVELAQVLATGLLYDLAALAYLLLPFAILALAWPNSGRGRRGHAMVASVLFAVAGFALLLVAAAEAVFWNEFAARFNFIAVDYLIYTREVVGNIRQSYPVPAVLAGLAMLAAVVVFAMRGPVWRSAAADGGGFARRLAATTLVVLAAVLSFALVGDRPRQALGSAGARELAGNGPYDLVHAFRSNDLDYFQFYRTLPADEARARVRASLAAGATPARFTGSAHPLEREVPSRHGARPLHVVLVSIESLGSDYVESFGGRPGLTPNLDRLAGQGLAFTNLYATGLRTVRGLEALTLSIPPTPGHAVPMREHNKGFQTFGGVLKEQGYEPLYVYGGYSRFDNMRDFFEGNGYAVVDRSAIASTDVSHETIWGVADEDLFKLALREIDARDAAGKKVFAHVMTTSNHRPFTYPAGRIDIAPGSGRDGAVKYTDWAIGEFIRAAAGRRWFANTVFVFVADHTSNGRGRTDLPPASYRIPLVVYAPGLAIEPARIDTLASQIDVAPTVLALLDVGYTSRFFGHDILGEGRDNPRAFMANYVTVGLMRDDRIVELSPGRRVRIVDARSGELANEGEASARSLTDDAIAHYQLAAETLKDGRRDRELAPLAAALARPAP